MSDFKALSLEALEDLRKQDYIFLDFRPVTQFCYSFIPGSMHCACTPLEIVFLNFILREKPGIVLVCPKGEEKQWFEALTSSIVDKESVAGYLEGGFASWEAAGKPLDVVISIEPDEFLMDLAYDNPQVVDIRAEEDFTKSHLPNSENIKAQDILLSAQEMPADHVYYMCDEDGYLSLFLISYLKTFNLHNFYHLQGGYDALLEEKMKASGKPSVN